MLTAAVVLVDRLRGRTRDPRDTPPLDVGWLLALSYAGVFSHVGLDFLNNYGVRLLARPTATLSLEAQQRRELKQKMFGD